MTTSPAPAAAEAPRAEASRRPSITVTISSIQGWPDIKPAVMSIAESAGRAGGDLVVTDGSRLPPPNPGELPANVSWHAFPGESVFQLRVEGYRLAAGDIVAITEDHVVVPADWAERMVEAHARHPEAIAIGGPVENGATRTRFDWASYLVVQVASIPPLHTGPTRRLSGAVNVTYKRAAFDGLDTFGGLGAMDGLHQRHLAKTGQLLWAEDSIRVFHDQDLTAAEFTSGHYNAGRTMSGFKRTHLGPVDVVRIVGAPFVPLARYGRMLVRLVPRGYGRMLLRLTPEILWLLYAQGLGQFIGYLAGPGDSPGKVQ